MNGLIWQCPYCKDIEVSFAREHHYIDSCKCAKSFVDCEEGYQRTTMNVVILKEFNDDEYPFGLELWHDCIEQGCSYYLDIDRMDEIKSELYKEIYL